MKVNLMQNNPKPLSGEEQDRLLTMQFERDEEALADKRFNSWRRRHQLDSADN